MNFNLGDEVFGKNNHLTGPVVEVLDLAGGRYYAVDFTGDGADFAEICAEETLAAVASPRDPGSHDRTLEARARCPIGPGSCHDCAMTCPRGNQVHDRDRDGKQLERLVPCGSEVFDEAGNIVLCGECRQAWGEN